ncbi:phage tail spike protein [Halobacillus karajensis]|uniref:phage tail spike protein n=1 Tax=Halobacillus karajensis TaxID=195088 RepID=UPI00045D2D85|nr:phage tail spike protein [Halobacillus karajensis]CDQ21711.1 hypothetical protein BN982_04120 [Halobacillus karajensis]
MLFIFNKIEKIKGVLDNSAPFSCPYFEDKHIENIETGEHNYQFSVPATHEKASDIEVEGFVLFSDLDDKMQMFQVKNIEEIADETEHKKVVTAEHVAISELLTQIVRPVTLTATTLGNALNYVLDGTGHEVGEIDYVGSKDIKIDSHITVLEAIYMIVELFEAEIQFETVYSNGVIKKKLVHVTKQRGRVTKKLFKYGKDLIDVKRTEDTEGLVTALIGVGKGDENGNPLTLAGHPESTPEGYSKVTEQDFISNDDALQRYGRNGKHIFGVYKDENATTQPLLFDNTFKELKKRSKPKLTFEMTIATLERITGYSADKVRVGDTVTIQDHTFKPALILEARIIQVTRSYTNPENDEVVLGDYRPIKISQNVDIESLQEKIQLKEEQWAKNKSDEEINVLVEEKVAPVRETANTAEGKADTADNKAENAQGTADEAKNDAQQAQNTADGALSEAQQAYQEALKRQMAIPKQPTAPENPTDGEFWVDTSEDRLKRYVNGGWKTLAPTTPEDIGAVDRAEYDQKVSEIETDLSNKQDELSSIKTDLSNKADEISAIQTDLEQQGQTLTEKADQSTLDAQVSSLKSDIADKAGLEYVDGELQTKADTATTYSKTEVDNALDSKVSTTQYQTDQDGIVTRLDSAESSITQNADSISSKVEQSTYEKGIKDTEEFARGLTGNLAPYHKWRLSNLSIVEDIDVNGELVNGLQHTATQEDETVYSNHFKVDPSKAYRVELWAKSDIAEGAWYFGMYGYNEAGDSIGAEGYSPVTGEQTDKYTPTNLYIRTGTTKKTTWTKYVAYMMPFDADPKEYTDLHTNVNQNIRLTQDHDNVRLRFLNHNNVDAMPTISLAKISVHEVNPAEITELKATKDRVSDAETAITQNAEAIELKAESTDVYTKSEVDSSLSDKADNSTVSSIETRVTNNEATLTVQSDEIASKVDSSTYTNKVTELEGNISTIEQNVSDNSTAITQNSDAIALKAESTDVYTKSEVDGSLSGKADNSTVSDLETRVTNNESSLTVHADQIASKVEQTTYNSDMSDLDSRVSNNKTAITQNAEAIELKAESSTVSDIDNRVTNNESTLSVHADQISSKVEQSDFNTVENRVTTAESNITQNANEISSKVEQSSFDAVESRVTTAESNITQNAEEIASKVSQTDFDSVENRLSSAESSIVQNADEIKSKVTSTEVQSQIDESKSKNYGYRYAEDIIVYGDADKYYPVVIKDGDQHVMRDILVKRRYSEKGPDSWNTSSHKGSITLLLKTNFGGWGGVDYSWEIHNLEQRYADLFAGAENVAGGTAFAIFLRGGGETGALYHLYSTQSLTEEGYNSGDPTIPPAPQIAYNEDLIFSTDSGYEYYAPPARTITEEVEKEIAERNFVKLSQNNADEIKNHETRITEAETSITQNKDEIALKANQTVVDDVEDRVTSAESTLSVHSDEIASKVEQTTFNTLEGRVDSAESSITQNSDAITSKVEKTTFDSGITDAKSHADSVANTAETNAKNYTDGEISPLDTRLTTAESTITQHSDQIQSRVKETTYNEDRAISGVDGDATNTASIDGTNAGKWYRIAMNSGNRAWARFIIRDTTSSQHGTIQFTAGTHYNKSSDVDFTLISFSRYSRFAFDKARILTGGIYDEQYLDLRFNGKADRVSELQYWIKDNIQTSGWDAVDFTEATIPDGYTSTEFNISGNDSVSGRITQAESSITQNADSIKSKVEQTTFDSLETRVGSAESSITQNANAITSKVEQTTFDGLESRVTTAESSITQNSDSIATKVSKGDISSTINQTAQGVKIEAQKLDLAGYATFSSLSGDGTTTIHGNNIETGTLSWTKGKGGVLELGGSGNVNGRLLVKDENDNTIADLDAEEGGFNKLKVGELKAPNVVSYNKKSYNLYVDPINGDDNNDGSGWDYAINSVQTALNRIAKFNEGDVKIILHYDNSRNIYENIRISGFTGSGSISIDFQNDLNQIKGTLSITACTNSIEILDGKLNTTNANACIELDRCASVVVNRTFLFGNDSSYSGVYTYAVDELYLNEVEVYDVDMGFYLNRGSMGYIRNCKGLATTTGVRAMRGAVISVYGTIPDGEATTKQAMYGGQLTGSASADTGSATPPAPPETTVEFTATSSASWTERYSTWDSTTGSDVLQGKWDVYGRYKGLWFFGTDISSTVQGKTIKDIKIYGERLSSGGYSGDVTMTFRSHNYSSQPSGEPSLSSEYKTADFAWGESGWVTIPSSMYDQFENGAKGFGVYTTSTSNGRYSRMSGDLTVRITYA